MDDLITNTKKKSKTLDIILISVFVILLAFVIFVTQFWVSLSVVDGNSMNNTLNNGDILLTDMLKKPERGDVVVFKFDENYDYIKRVIAIPGDVIYNDTKGNVYLKKAGEDTAQILAEPYAFISDEDKNSEIQFYHEVLEGEYFVIGDNRCDSYDSRFFGAIKKEQIIGVVTNFWIENKAGTTKLFAFRR